MWWAVDRVEGRWAVLISDSGQTAQLPRGSFREGRVYWYDGQRLRRDVREERRRLAAARAQLQRLKATDPGGNIRL
jgi:hypothetical protein